MAKSESTLTVAISDIYRQSHHRSAGYVDEILAHGVLSEDGKMVEIDKASFLELRAKYSTPPLLTETLLTASISIARWAAAGFPIASESALMARSCQCWLCPQWDARAQRCLACGCYSLKHWLETEKCPLGKWPI